jgi:hypothetical protein
LANWIWLMATWFTFDGMNETKENEDTSVTWGAEINWTSGPWPMFCLLTDRTNRSQNRRIEKGGYKMLYNKKAATQHNHHAESTSRFGINRSGTWKRNKQEQHRLEWNREQRRQHWNSIGLFSLLMFFIHLIMCS